MSEKKKFYITTAIAYTSRKPHIGNAYDIVLADMIARYKRARGYEVFLQTGSDEHGQKIEEYAKAAGITPKEYVDGVSAQIKALQSGDFTDDMMQKAVLRYAFQAAAASDTISDLAMQSILMLRRGDPRSPQEITAAMQKVTRAEIAAAAKQLVPDVVYVLRAEQEEAEADDI